VCWDTRCANSKWFHNVCVIPSERYWPSTYAAICASFEEAIATLCHEKGNWRCDFCNRPLFLIVTKGWFDVIIYYLFTSCDVYIQIKWYLMCIFLSFTKCLGTRKFKLIRFPILTCISFLTFSCAGVRKCAYLNSSQLACRDIVPEHAAYVMRGTHRCEHLSYSSIIPHLQRSIQTETRT